MLWGPWRRRIAWRKCCVFSDRLQGHHDFLLPLLLPLSLSPGKVTARTASTAAKKEATAAKENSHPSSQEGEKGNQVVVPVTTFFEHLFLLSLKIRIWFHATLSFFVRPTAVFEQAVAIFRTLVVDHMPKDTAKLANLLPTYRVYQEKEEQDLFHDQGSILSEKLSLERFVNNLCCHKI